MVLFGMSSSSAMPLADNKSPKEKLREGICPSDLSCCYGDVVNVDLLVNEVTSM